MAEVTESQNPEQENPRREWFVRYHNELLQRYETGEISRVEYLERLADGDEEKEQRADHDPLTGFFNRNGLDRTLNIELAEIKRLNLPGVMLVLDVDHLKDTNDTMGHLAGDILLIIYSQIMEVCTRKSDPKARWGGDEFGIFLPATDSEHAAIIAERIRATVEEVMPQVFLDLPWQQTISIGLTQVRDDDTPDTLINRADQGLYQAKEKRNKVVII